MGANLTSKGKPRKPPAKGRPKYVHIGRPTIYRPEVCDRLLDYFNSIPATYKTKDGTIKANMMPTVEGFCRQEQIAKDTYYNWVKRHSAFSDAHEKAQAIQEAIWLENSMLGRYNPAFTIFFAKNKYGWTDQVKHEVQIGVEDRLRKLLEGQQQAQIEHIEEAETLD